MVESISERVEQLKARGNERSKRFWIDNAVAFGTLIPAAVVTAFAKNEPASFPLVLACMTLSFTSWAVSVRNPIQILNDLTVFLKESTRRQL